MVPSVQLDYCLLLRGELLTNHRSRTLAEEAGSAVGVCMVLERGTDYVCAAMWGRT